MAKEKEVPRLYGRFLLDTSGEMATWVLGVYDECKLHTIDADEALRLCAIVCQTAAALTDNSSLNQSMLAKLFKDSRGSIRAD